MYRAGGFGSARPTTESLVEANVVDEALWSRATRACQEFEYRPSGTTPSDLQERTTTRPRSRNGPATVPQATRRQSSVRRPERSFHQRIQGVYDGARRVVVEAHVHTVSIILVDV